MKTSELCDSRKPPRGNVVCALPLAPHETDTYESLLQSMFTASTPKLIALLHVHAMFFHFCIGHPCANFLTHVRGSFSSAQIMQFRRTCL